jgi:hypothetical protein
MDVEFVGVASRVDTAFTRYASVLGNAGHLQLGGQDGLNGVELSQ